MTEFIHNFWQITLEAAPWLLLGLLIAGLMKAWLPAAILSRHLGEGKMAIIKAALIGAPLPLCSCGVIPVATELKRSGASAPATSSFLVATPETGVDSISVSYAMLGPVMALYRPIAAITSAIITGFLVLTAKEIKAEETLSKADTCCATKSPVEPEIKSSCCSSQPKPPTVMDKTLQGVHYGFTKLIDDIAKWLVIGLLFATIIRTFLPESFLLSYGSGIPAMLMMILISVPMYICATASTPIAAGLIMAGISPGTALVFMMAGPATNISTLGVIKNEMGMSVLIRYLLGIILCSLGFGLLLDWGIANFDISIGEQMLHSHELLPLWLSSATAILLIFLTIKPLRQVLIK